MCRLFWIDCVAARLCHTPTLSVVFWWWSVVWLEQTNKIHVFVIVTDDGLSFEPLFLVHIIVHIITGWCDW